MKKEKTPKDQETRSLIIFTTFIVFMAVISIAGHTKKRIAKEQLKEPVAVNYHSFEQNLNRSIKSLIIHEYEEDTLLYLGISNRVIDTAWVYDTEQGRIIYNMLINKRTGLLNDPAVKKGKELKEYEEKLDAIERQLRDLHYKYGKQYGWRIIHTCYLNGNKKEIVIESDSTGNKVKEVYGDRYNYTACKDSALLQYVLKEKFKE